MTSSDASSSDPYLANLRYLANETALPTKLEECRSLLDRLPETLIPSSAPTYQKARVLLALLKAVVDRAHTSIKTDHNDAHVGMVLAAGTVMGLVTEEPNDYVHQPSEMTRKPATGNKEARQALAATWLVPPLSTARSFRDREQECLDAFRHALLDFLEDEQSVRALAQRLGTGPIAAPVAPAEPGTEPVPAPSPSWLAAHRRPVLAGATGLLIVIGLGLGLSLGLTSSPSAAPGSTGANGGSAGGSGTQAIGLPPGHKTYVEQEGHIGERWTYTNPFNPVDTGPAVQPLQKVYVSCKVYAPSFGSVSPDGYWYRLASPPYNNRDYGIANTFLNGNPVVGTSNVKQNNTDFKVPNCPG